MLMSFIGCIGVLMRGTGLEDLLGCAFAGVPNMMNCKAWPNALRALRMVTSTLLDEVHYRGITVVDLQAELEKARQLPTGRPWVDCLVIPVAIVHIFIRAERESDRLLHLYCVQQMLPYFFAAGHANYARYGAWHLLEMRGALSAAALQMCMNGDHVRRHRSGVWNSVFSDQFGEQTYIRYGKAKGGLVGITLNPDQVAGLQRMYLKLQTGNQPHTRKWQQGRYNEMPNHGAYIKTILYGQVRTPFRYLHVVVSHNE